MNSLIKIKVYLAFMLVKFYADMTQQGKGYLYGYIDVKFLHRPFEFRNGADP